MHGTTVPLDTGTQQSVARLEALARLMDGAFVLPGTTIRFGLDGIIGLIPVHGLRIGLFVQVPAKEGHVLHVGPEQNVERIAHNWDRADRGVEEDVGEHPRNQPAWRAELPGFPDEIGRYQRPR